MEVDMLMTGYQHFADALVFAHGPKALAEATRHAELCMKQGDTDMAAHWQATITEVRGMTAKSLVPSINGRLAA
jgi:hypothetical protein